MIMLKHLISLIGLLIIPIPLFSQTLNYPISGTIVDANSLTPISGATVIISTGFGQNATSDTLITDSNGEVNDTISLNESAYGVACFVSAEGYSSTFSYSLVEGGEITLGTIELDESLIDTSMSIGSTPGKMNNIIADHIQIYSANGKLLYEGKTFDYSEFKNLRKSNNQQIVVVKKLKGKIVSIYKKQLFK